VIQLKYGRTYTMLFYHVIFSTKGREQTITNEKLSLIRIYAKEKCESLRIKLVILNGYQDHIHILLSIPPRYSLSQIIKEIKGYTSYKISELKWQRGYGAFTVDKNSFSEVLNILRIKKGITLLKKKWKKRLFNSLIHFLY
jgi:putative transposase